MRMTIRERDLPTRRRWLGWARIALVGSAGQLVVSVIVGVPAVLVMGAGAPMSRIGADVAAWGVGAVVMFALVTFDDVRLPSNAIVLVPLVLVNALAYGALYTIILRGLVAWHERGLPDPDAPKCDACGHDVRGIRTSGGRRCPECGVVDRV